MATLYACDRCGASLDPEKGDVIGEHNFWDNDGRGFTVIAGERTQYKGLLGEHFCFDCIRRILEDAVALNHQSR
jgi:hypothetical protein